VLVADTSPAGPAEEILVAYRDWLVRERGLAPTTIRDRVKLARRLVEGRAEHDAHAIGDLASAEVTAFLLGETSRCRANTAKTITGQLRSFLRFLYVKGLTPVQLAAAVPPVAGWRDTSIPRGIPAQNLEGILDSCDRNHPGGIRDRAILTLVGRLGLRCIEVARLEVADIDWRAGEIVVRGKARRQDRLPLPADVGEALVSYLCQVRAATTIRPVFLTLRAPTRPIKAGVVNYVCRRACQRAGLPPVGAHRLRHTLATEMLRRGASLVEVGQVLRHQDLVTTAIYAKVDIATLRAVAQPWPGVLR
jgi:site-specific recombinase XerD